MLRAVAGVRPTLDAEQLAALLCPPQERPRRGRWLLFAAALHAAVIAGLFAMPKPSEPEQVVLVHLLPMSEEAAAGPPAAAAAPAPSIPEPKPAPAKPAPPPRVPPPPAPKPRIAAEPLPEPTPAPVTARNPDPAPAEATPEAASTGGSAAATDGAAHAATNGAHGRNGAGHAKGLAGLDPAYVRRFLASLDRHKQYPRAARARRLEGTTLVWMRMDRSGRVLASKVEKSSGHGVLDRAVLQTVRDANPLPALPASDDRSQVELVVPIAFQMR